MAALSHRESSAEVRDSNFRFPGAGPSLTKLLPGRGPTTKGHDMTRQRTVDTVVIGAGHSGLAMSWYLSRAGRDHVVLDRRETPGGGWQDRWDSFRLVTPNRFVSFPGSPYSG